MPPSIGEWLCIPPAKAEGNADLINTTITAAIDRSRMLYRGV